MAAQGRLIGLDYLRAAAIVCVLAGHTAGQHAPGALGFTGVEIFFVLSGYLIGGILMSSYARSGDTISWPMTREFWIRRWLRTVPNYFLFLFLYAVLEQYGLQPKLLLYAIFTQNLAWPMDGLFQVSWSLTVEEWFYLLLPLLTGIWFYFFGRIKPALTATVLLMFTVPLLLRLTVCAGHPFDAGMRKVVVFRLDALMWGVALVAAQRYRPRLFKHLCRPVYAVIGAAGMLGVSWWIWRNFQSDVRFPATRVGALMMTALSPCCALLLPCCTTIPRKLAIVDRCAYLTSTWSYSIYLCHVPVVRLTARFCGDPHLAKPAVIALVWLLSFAVAAVVYYSFERPILRWRDRITGSGKSPAKNQPAQETARETQGTTI